MAQTIMRIGTRESQLAVWQATQVQSFLKAASVTSELVYIKSEGDVDTVTPLYALGVQGVFTKALDAALLNNRIDIAVHSMKDVPTQLAQGIKQAAVLKRASHKDIFVAHPDLPEGKAIFAQTTLKQVGSNTDTNLSRALQCDEAPPSERFGEAVIATSSIRRIAQWLHRYPNHQMVNLRGNVNTRLRKLKESNWNGAIFAAAGLERIDLRPQNSIDLDWMLPAPAQGAIMVVCREEDDFAFEACQSFNDAETALCTKIEREFLRTLLGGCSTPISALAEVKDNTVFLKGNIVSPDGRDKIEVTQQSPFPTAAGLGVQAANELLAKGGDEIVGRVRKMKTPDGKV